MLLFTSCYSLNFLELGKQKEKINIFMVHNHISNLRFIHLSTQENYFGIDFTKIHLNIKKCHYGWGR